MNKPIIKIPVTEYETTKCHKLREYVLKESFADSGMTFDRYDRDHHVHGLPNISLVYILNDKVIGSVRLDKKFEHLEMNDGEIRLALFAIDPSDQTSGFGRDFFKGIIEWCKKNSIHTIHTNSRLISHAFWKKMGLEDNVWDELGIDDSEVQMTYKL